MRPPHGLSTDPGWRRVSSGCYVVLHCAASTAAPCPGVVRPLFANDHDGFFPGRFFGDGQSPVYAPFPSTPEASRLKVLPRGREKLSPAQQRFNKLLARVENLAASCRTCSVWQQTAAPHLARMAELKRKMDEARREMLVFLHQRLQRKGLTAAQQKAMREILQSLLPSSGPVDESDPELAELCSIYAPPPLEDDLGDQANMVREQMLDMAQSVLGKTLDREAFKGIDSPEELMEALIPASAYLSGGGGCAAGRAPLSRPPSARQLKAQEQAQDAKAALRSIYRQLASALHPDREPDPGGARAQERVDEPANAAYEQGDLTALLQLQLQAEQVDEAHIAPMADDKLAALSLLLKDQVKTLEGEWETQRCA